MGQFVAVVSVGGLRPHSADKAFAVEHGSDVFCGHLFALLRPRSCYELKG